MVNNLKKTIKLSLFIFGFLLFSSGAQAASSIEVTFGPEFALNGQNMAPGDTVKGTFTVKNLTDSTQNLAMKLKIQEGIWQSATHNIEEKLFIKIKKPDGNFALMPNGTTEQVLSELQDNPFTFYTLSGPMEHTESFELWATLDPAAGNEYQGKKVVFDILAGIEITEETITTTDDNDNRHRRGGRGGRTLGNLITTAIGGTAEESEEPAAEPTEESANKTESEVKGEEAVEECQAAP